jgi:hypothetical protein
MRAWRLLVVAGACCCALLLGGSPASAQDNQEGGCDASANGQNVRGFLSPGSALAVDKDEALAITATAPESGAYSVFLEFAGFRWRVAEDTYDGTTWARDVRVDDYASHGIGLYKVIAESTMSGSTCKATAYVHVKGGSPFTTTAGMVGTGVAAVGLAGTMLGAIRAGKVAANAAAVATSGGAS